MGHGLISCGSMQCKFTFLLELFVVVAGLNRCGKSCRLRWTNYLRPDLKHDNFTPQEEELIINLHEAIGSRYVDMFPLFLFAEKEFFYSLSVML